jgi:hypothetical protein
MGIKAAEGGDDGPAIETEPRVAVVNADRASDTGLRIPATR